MTTLIVGGTKGLGLELARLLKAEHEVIITGRTDPSEEGVQFFKLDLERGKIEQDISKLMQQIPHVDLLIYAAGFFQDGHVGDLTQPDIDLMVDVGYGAPATLLSWLCNSEEQLAGFIAITSTSQWTPREREPVYTGVKAGLAMLANSMSLDPHMGKVLVAAPSGMRTPFWDRDGRDTSGMLDPVWVAQKILELWKNDYKYRFAQILRGPERVEIVETRSE